jgi:hypothetical protein
MVGSCAFQIADEDFLGAYERLWASHDRDSFFRSPNHLAFIRDVTKSELGFALALRDGEPVAAMPFAIKPGKAGAVINSLPFYGTYGAIVGEADGTVPVIVEGLLDHARRSGVAAVTLIDDWRSPCFGTAGGEDFRTERSNQFIDLARMRSTAPIELYHQKTRNLVRKAEKIGVQVRRSQAVDDIAGLAAAHRENMAAVNGIAKPQRFFDLLAAPERPLGDSLLYVASIDGRDCAYLLMFRCGDTVEYYMPAVFVADRASQPLSLLIHRAVCDAVEGGFRFWNFGGTWPTQDSLRHFKIRWGASETQYSYYTYILDKGILAAERDSLLRDYPFFFVAPFDRVAAAGGSA